MNDISVIDYFNLDSQAYATCRPKYPEELFRWIASVVQTQGTVVDAGTGNGQSAINLARHFKKVLAIDVSQNQLRHAVKCSNVEYICASIENMGLLDNSIDLVASASAAHWFNLPKFYQECRRILLPHGAIVLFTYTWPETSDPLVSRGLKKVKKILDPYWSYGSRLHLNRYQDLPFPLKEMSNIPQFVFSVQWNLYELIGFLSTWACIKKYVATLNKLFYEDMLNILISIWPQKDPEAKVEIEFPLYIKAGYIKDYLNS